MFRKDICPHFHFMFLCFINTQKKLCHTLSISTFLNSFTNKKTEPGQKNTGGGVKWKEGGLRERGKWHFITLKIFGLPFHFFEGDRVFLSWWETQENSAIRKGKNRGDHSSVVFCGFPLSPSLPFHSLYPWLFDFKLSVKKHCFFCVVQKKDSRNPESFFSFVQFYNKQYKSSMKTKRIKNYIIEIINYNKANEMKVKLEGREKGKLGLFKVFWFYFRFKKINKRIYGQCYDFPKIQLRAPLRAPG